MKEEISKLAAIPETETDDATKLNNSLQELKELCSQLHYAADYCEKTFLNAEKKRGMVENTKEYLCRAVVTVVDHLGSVSDNLEIQLSKTDTTSETELRIDNLRQRLVTCQKYSHGRALSRLFWSADLPRYHCRYISPPTPDLKRMKEMSRDGFEAEEEVPLFLYTYNYKPSLVEDAEKRNGFSSPVLPVRDGSSVAPNAQNSYFEFQEARKTKRNILNWKPVHNKDIMALIRRGRRTQS